MNNSGEVEYNPFLQTAAESQALWLPCFPPMGDGGRQASCLLFLRGIDTLITIHVIKIGPFFFYSRCSF